MQHYEIINNDLVSSNIFNVKTTGLWAQNVNISILERNCTPSWDISTIALSLLSGITICNYFLIELLHCACPNSHLSMNISKKLSYFIYFLFTFEVFFLMMAVSKVLAIYMYIFFWNTILLQSPWSGVMPQTVVSSPASAPATVAPSTISATPAVPVGTQAVASQTCNWTEHTSPEGYKYYYNSVTTESRVWFSPLSLSQSINQSITSAFHSLSLNKSLTSAFHLWPMDL